MQASLQEVLGSLQEMKGSIQELAQHVGKSARDFSQSSLERIGLATPEPEPVTSTVVRNAGKLILLGSVAAVAWGVYQSLKKDAAHTPVEDEDYDDVDHAMMDSFPASDPPSFNARSAN